jgi:hypothetical protein
MPLAIISNTNTIQFNGGSIMANFVMCGGSTHMALLNLDEGTRITIVLSRMSVHDFVCYSTKFLKPIYGL